jgi:hypothetical protein
VSRPITSRVSLAGWLLCVVLVCLAIHSPHCDHCDGALVVCSPGTVVDHPQPVVPDACNGICWCCGFHWLPNLSSFLIPDNRVIARIQFESPSFVPAPHAGIFQPPRIAISS